jgi:hypothetical protein
MFLANGEVTDADGNDIAEEIAARQAERWAEYAPFLVLSDYDEPFFSWSHCEGCGSELGGDRVMAAVVC